MRAPRPRTSDAPTRAQPPALIPVAIGCALLWVTGAVAVFGIHGWALFVIAGMGGVAALSLLGVVQRQQRQLRGLAATDALTDLANHRGFHELLSAEIARARRARQPVTLITLDLDNFKAVNDTHGHPYGDEVLRAVGKQLRRVIRSDDHAARVGGEEFALILPGLHGQRAFEVAERARHALETVPVHGFQLTCSAGMATYPTDADDGPSLYQLADSALYWAKRGGKRRTRRFDPDHGPEEWSDGHRAELAALLDHPEPVRAVFQPVVALATGRLVGYEALARFPSAPNRSAAVWFAQAHGSGLGPELEAAAIRSALEPLGRPVGTHLALNVSPSALSTDVVQRALPDNLAELVIEITEHEFVPDDNTLAQPVAELRERGAQVAIDDAGAGHAGLKQLMRIRPDIVKLDRALTSAIHDDPARLALVESFVWYARDVGATVCAEGIESLDDLAALADLDVQWGQGHVLGRPAPPWAEVSPVASEVCRAALAEAFRVVPSEGQALGASDRRLVHLTARLAGARSREDLQGTLAIIAAELRASEVCLSQWIPDEGVVQTLAETGDVAGQTRFTTDGYPLTERVLTGHEAVQVVVDDPESDPAETDLLLALGQRSLLMVPVVARGESLGLLEAYSTLERPWTRAEINRARVIANQFASVIQTVFQPDG